MPQILTMVCRSSGFWNAFTEYNQFGKYEFKIILNPKRKSGNEQIYFPKIK
jgi:hypothetical protein